MLRIIPRWTGVMSTSPNGYYHDSDGRDIYEPFHKLAKVQIQPPRNPNKPPTSFRIRDILGIDDTRNNHRNRNDAVAAVPRIVRPWDASPSSGRDSENSSDLEDGEINVEDDTPPKTDKHNKDVSPLDALMGMTNKIFEGLETTEAADAKRREQAALFGKHQPPKKRRKSRTAFTNQQIYELEKRFLYQKYLTPADRDEIAQTLGLTNAQVITWFQNRRAKLKRDLEELKNDVTATKRLLTSPEMSDSEREPDVTSPPQECPNSPRDCSTPKTPSSPCTSDSCEERSHSPSNTEDSENKSVEET